MPPGTPYAHELDFSTGLPTGAVVYSVLGNDNLPMAGLSDIAVIPNEGAMSLMLLVPPAANTCNKPLFETRTLTWHYVTATGVVSGRTRYRVDREIPFPVTEDGVRGKLGLESHELDDKDINLLLAYGSLVEKYPAGVLDTYATAGNLQTLIVVNAIEAQAALDVLPSLQLAVAKAEDSGTNKYQRFGTIDWNGLAESLGRVVSRLDIQLGLDLTVSTSSIFFAVGSNTDRLTGGDYV